MIKDINEGSGNGIPVLFLNISDNYKKGCNRLNRLLKYY
jgi:hypothetical protein